MADIREDPKKAKASEADNLALIDFLKRENAALMAEISDLKLRLAHLTAQYVWVEGGSFYKIQQEIAPFGYKLIKGSEGYTPRIVPLEQST